MLDSYVSAIRQTRDLLDGDFDRAVETVAALNSILIVTGLGKSGLIAQKAAATLRSTGTQAAFVHPVEALHGDLGIVEQGSAMLAISKSGANEETIEFVKQFKAVTDGYVITISEPGSRLGQYANAQLSIPRAPEIDDWNLAPTTSSTTSLAICDVFAISVQQAKGLTERDFAQFHPSGSLGKRLLLRAGDVMIRGQSLPIMHVDTPFVDVLYEISSKGLGLVLLTRDSGDLFGVLTDGDVRRLMERKVSVTGMSGRECFDASRRADDLPTVKHGWTTEDTKAVDCLEMMQASRITSLVILQGEKPIGLVRMQELVQAGL